MSSGQAYELKGIAAQNKAVMAPGKKHAAYYESTALPTELPRPEVYKPFKINLLTFAGRPS